MYKNLIFLFLLLLSANLAAQETIKTLKVKGNCGMCKDRIEAAVRELPSAHGEWNGENETLTVHFFEKETSLDAIAKNIAKVGHDNELYKADDAVYKSLANCCLYDREDFTNESSQSSNSHLETQTILVRGNCKQCKERIETAVNKFPSAQGIWNIGSKVLTVQFDPKKTSFKSIMKEVANVGHDNELFLADNTTYKSLETCCLYNRELSWDEIAYSEGTHGFDEEHSHSSQTDLFAEYDEVESFDDYLDDTVGLETVTITTSTPASAMDKKSVGLQLNISDKELLKAACCNLSESFETNATVDVSYSNAVSGTKQLKMLGLDQKYVLLTKELLPEIRGISAAYGMNFIPGRWIEGIQLVKGTGSVTNGYESIAGHINTELYKSDTKPKTSLNFYGDTSTRFEGNFVHNKRINDKWTQSILLSGAATTERQDHNNDGFMDQPIGRGVNLSYLLNFNDLQHSGFTTHFGLNYVNDHRLGGQVDFNEKYDKLGTTNYGIGIDIQRFQFWNKSGYIFPSRPYQSIGWMNQFTYHEQESYFGQKTYDAEQKTFYSNLIFESILGTTEHRYKTGLSFLYDRYDELYNFNSFKRNETVPGVFFEYTYGGDKLTVVTGARVDFHNLAGTQFTPRINVKYDITPKTIVRASIGKGFRTANIFAESQAYLTSNRQIQVIDDGGKIYGLKPEIAWNYGISLQQEFIFFNRRSTIVADFFRTDFQDQVVLDLDTSPQQILFYNLDGKSYANSLQIQWDFQLFRRLDTRLAYKFYDTKTNYLSGSKELPFTSQHRGFLNLSYATLRTANGQHWSFDTTLQWVGKQRLPDSSSNPVEFQSSEYGKSYFLLNAQVSRNFNKNIRLYLGGDNLLSYTQDNAIVDVKNPFGNYFDGGMVYAPVMPATVYLGIDIDF